MIAFLARYLMRRLPDTDIEAEVSRRFPPLAVEDPASMLSDEELDAEVLRRFPAPPPPRIGEMIDAIAEHPDFRGFLAWRRTSAEGDEDWGWLAVNMDKDDVLFQLERAAEQVIASVPGKRERQATEGG